MAGTHFRAGVAAGGKEDSPTVFTFWKKGTISVTVSALAAAAEEDISLTITGVAVGDYVDVIPPNSAAETGLAKALCWVSAANTVKVRISNLNAAAALAGSTANWTYVLIRS